MHKSRIPLIFFLSCLLHTSKVTSNKVWDNWSKFSSCSRSCGGGVQIRTRMCLHQRWENSWKRECRDPKSETEYRSCNTQNCPARSFDFRALQCQEFDATPLNGKTYQWKPYYDGEKRCSLMCAVSNGTFFHEWKKTVIDGTKCDQQTDDVCVGGICKPAGCDNVLGSTARRNKCRICNGDEQSCQMVEGSYSIRQLQTGYNEIGKLPKGASSITVGEMRPSSNYIVLRTRSGTFIANKYLEPGKPPVIIDIAGTYLQYTYRKSGNGDIKSITGAGPTTEEIYIYLLTRDKMNPGIWFRYYIPRTVDTKTRTAHSQTRTSHRRTGTDQSQTRTSHKRTGTAYSHTRTSHSQSRADNSQTRTFHSKITFPPRENTEIRGKEHRNKETQSYIRNNHIHGVNYAWSYGRWTNCSVKCGKGKKRRAIACRDRKTGKIVDYGFCDAGKRPANYEDCLGERCDNAKTARLERNVEWRLGDWGPCSATCDTGNQIQNVECVAIQSDQSAAQVQERQCEQTHGRKPEYRRACNQDVQCAVWSTTAWSSCSRKCGLGEQTRQVYCVDSYSRKLSNTACSEDKKPKSYQSCMIQPCKDKSSLGSSCLNTIYGCCKDGTTAASGPDSEGCPEHCLMTRYGCCSDGKTISKGSSGEGCPPDCSRYRYGCCTDNRTVARGPDNEGCPNDCSVTKYGCCSDRRTPAKGFNGEGCLSECSRYRYGCCPDNQTIARGPNNEGCNGSTDCSLTRFGCCSDKRTPARGENGEGCPPECRRYRYGCCPDNQTIARGPGNKGCFGMNDCSVTRYGCCPDGRTSARGRNGDGCVPECIRMRFGCCLDNKTAARGPNKEGCPNDCSLSRYGCCSDRRTPARGKNGEGCHTECRRFRYGCCPDKRTAARGPNNEGCPHNNNCSVTRYGCCPDRRTPARGENGEGCPPECNRYRYGCCSDNQTVARGPNNEGCPHNNDCSMTRYGCCPDRRTPARGENGQGCPPECNRYRYGCCPDNQTVARGPNNEGCPHNNDCSMTRYGCCPDRRTPARGENGQGCPPECNRYRYGCCPDNQTVARGPNNEGCPHNNDCSMTRYGCCPDRRTPARGEDGQGCPPECNRYRYGCCPDNQTVARGPNNEGCFNNNDCTMTRYGCCPDRVTPARGRNGEGCVPECIRMRFGCCPDNRTAARGLNYEGCPNGCSVSKYGCCSDRKTPASGENGEGCPPECSRFRYGCCPDNQTVSQGPNNEGCPHNNDCSLTRYGCCPDRRTPARGENGKGCPPECRRFRYGCCPDNQTVAQGPNNEGCYGRNDCSVTRYGCCPDGRTPARGRNEEGCVPECIRMRYGCCPDNKTAARGPNQQGCPFNCAMTRYGCCSDGRTPARGKNEEGCPPECSRFRYGCCPDNQTVARGPNNEGCPNSCSLTRYGCCSDRRTAARGKNGQGCPPECMRMRYGCCPDNKTAAQGPDNFGCPLQCSSSLYGCCPNSNIAATGPNYQGCPYSCSLTLYGCCPDNYTSATGPMEEGCPFSCSQAPYGCCRDGLTPARGPGMEGCRLHNDCEQSTYGCCHDGQTPAAGPEGQGCPTTERDNHGNYCLQKKERGKCTDYVVKWYYDGKKCNRFWYGGCDGNNNRFETQDECMAKCSGKSDNEVITDRILCSMSYFKCCRDGITFARGPNYLGCPGEENRPSNDNNRPKTSSFCYLSSDHGPCSDYTIRWFYNSTQGLCHRFWYGGCDGNRNNFMTKNECSSSCSNTEKPSVTGQPYVTRQPPVTRQPSVTRRTDQPPFVGDQSCLKNSERGPCSNYTVKWYYDGSTSRCKRFWYGGCGGNPNRFDNQSLCLAKCTRRQPVNPVDPGRDICQLPSRTGRCRASKPRWYFDSSSKECHTFIYGGCDGNANNFLTRTDCYTRCMPKEMVRNLHAEKTTSREIMLEWEPPQNNDVSSYKLSYMGTKYYRDSTKQDAMREIILSGAKTNYMMENLMDGADYTVNLYPLFNGGRQGPKVSLVTKTKPADVDVVLCDDTKYGCCSDGVSAASGPQQQGCPASCKDSQYGCCDDDKTYATGPDQEGCDTTGEPSGDDFCTDTVYGCCPDKTTPAQGPNYEGCKSPGKPTPTGICSLKNDRGSCTDYAVKWFYNRTASRCDMFWYGGCGGNDNRFETKESCEGRCRGIEPDSTNNVPVCEQPKVVGRCRASMPRYYFNGKQCELFYYGGCQGNQNNFVTLKQCEEQCVIDIDPDKPDVLETCQQPMDTGPCRAIIPKWYYDTEKKDCVEFSYGGCQGNDNRFDTRDECLNNCGVGGKTKPLDKEEEDICRLTHETGTCKASIPRWYYDYHYGVCKQFTYGGCDGNKNNFETQEQCESACDRKHVCKNFVYPPFQCLAYMRRFKYDPEISNCVEFIYGGCGGNSNNFGTMDACVRKCAPEKLTTTKPVTWKEVCKQPADVGDCGDSLSRYHYNSATQRCEIFRYGGCGGNNNNFESSEQCESYCGKTEIEGSGEVEEQEYCHLRQESGRCEAYMPAWHYDHLTGTCNEFIYGGCDGNDNRFPSREVCESSCSRESVCSLEKKEGNCLAIIPRYFYNPNTGICETFNYGGCGGNANNFDSLEACQRKCRGSRPGILETFPTQLTVSPVAQDPFSVLVTWQEPPNSGGQIRGYQIFYHTDANAADHEWTRQNVAGNRTYSYIRGLLPNTMYYFKIHASNQVGYGPWSQTVVYRTPGRDAPTTTLAPPTTREAPATGRDPICMLPVNRGSCNNMTIMYYYDPSIKDCRPFRYYGCTGNQNRFSTGQKCRERCWDGYNVIRPVTPAPRITTTTQAPDEGTIITLDVCDEDYERGPCTDYSVKWYYSRTNRTCKRFWYGGCDGNANRFDSREECDSVCIKRVRPQPATTPKPDTDIDNQIDKDSCTNTRYGCCPDGITPARDDRYSNCNDDPGPDTEIIEGDYTSLIEQPGRDVTIKCTRYRPQSGRSIDWYKDGLQIVPNNRYAIQQDGSLLIRTAIVDDTGMYACRVAGIGSSAEIERFRLQIEVPIEIFPTPAIIIVRPGEDAFLHCQAIGNPRPRVSWTRNGVDVSRDPRFTVYQNGTLIIKGMLESDMGNYLCIARNGVSNPAERLIKLQLKESLRVVIDPVEGRKREGERLYLRCTGNGYPSPSIQWEKNGQTLTSDQRISAVGGLLRITNLALEDTGLYTCIVKNNEESVKDSVSIQVVPQDLKPADCKNKSSRVKCNLIVRARLCGYSVYSSQCCESCENEKQRLLRINSK